MGGVMLAAVVVADHPIDEQCPFLVGHVGVERRHDVVVAVEIGVPRILEERGQPFLPA
jgi:hypothetical protein